jgi:hypothetical protein
MLNQCTLTGNLGGDPEVFYSSEGNPVASFSLAFHSSKKKTGWIKVVCFQKLAEVSAKIPPQGGQDRGHRDSGPASLGNGRRSSEELLPIAGEYTRIYQD